jgi:hypothetical protein
VRCYQSKIAPSIAYLCELTMPRKTNL